MMYFVSPVDARNWLMDYLYDREEAIPDEVREELRRNMKEISPVEAVVKSIRLLFDRWIDVPSDLQEWGASAATMCASFGLSDIDDDVAEIMKGGL